MSSRIKVYEYRNCSTCKNALKFLDQRGVEYDKRAIVDEPPSKAELRKMLGFLGGDVKKLFNTSGQVYRELKLSEKLPKLSLEQALDLLSSNGKLVKRPFLLTASGGAVGFKQEEWKKLV
jgi:Spx/MgsR family transcriptional regulator